MCEDVFMKPTSMLFDSIAFPSRVQLNSRGCDPFETEHVTDVSDPTLELVAKLNGMIAGASN